MTKLQNIFEEVKSNPTYFAYTQLKQQIDDFFKKFNETSKKISDLRDGCTESTKLHLDYFNEKIFPHSQNIMYLNKSLADFMSRKIEDQIQQSRS